jgi:hypothetical protein
MNYSTTAEHAGLRTAGATESGRALLGAVTRWLRRLADAIEPSPQQRVASDVAYVRALADSWRHADPGFASDLYAAANRHESDLDATPGR